ncbi:MAG: TRAP transporter large permease subunit [Lentisphaeria bacterium]|nr:TRAP transporter large permease subunit [Lentisphaeria bacterium]
MNPVVFSVAILLLLSLLRLNVVFAIIIAALAGGLWAGLGESETLEAFSSGLGDGARIAFNYAMLGAFSIVISRSGLTELLARTLLKKINREITGQRIAGFKYILLLLLMLISMSSQNLIPIHIAFIPILIPSLLPVFAKFRLDRRMIACILTFGLITPYMCFPFGFGRIYLNDILLGNLKSNGVVVDPSQTVRAMAIPALGMLIGLLIAVFISYRKPRDYDPAKMATAASVEVEIRPIKIIAGVVAVVVGFAAQIWLDSLFIAALAAVLVFVIARVIHLRDTQDVFVQGVYLMGAIGIVMIAANGFASVMKATGGVETLVEFISRGVGEYRGLAVFMMLFIGLLVTMGIGSSFSTVPLIAAIYVPLCVSLGMSPLATLAVVGVAGALGDAGSPVSESVLGPTAGLNADGQHDHIYDSTVPTFLHYNIPLLIAGWIAGMVL